MCIIIRVQLLVVVVVVVVVGNVRGILKLLASKSQSILGFLLLLPSMRSRTATLGVYVEFSDFLELDGIRTYVVTISIAFQLGLIVSFEKRRTYMKAIFIFFMK